MPWLLGRRKRVSRMEAGPDSVLIHTAGRAAVEPSLHPRLWLAFGVSYVVIGATQMALAALWRWWFGVAIGFGLAKMGMSLTGLGLTGGRPLYRPEGHGVGGWFKGTLARAVLWGSGKIQRLFYLFRWVIYLYGAIVLLMVLVHISSPDLWLEQFPLACPRSKRMGCSRIAEVDPHGARHLQPLHLPSAMGDVQAAVEEWVGLQAQARALQDSRPGFVHARFLSFFWGFPDDMMIGLRCNERSLTVVEVQGQLRVGKSDLGVNGRRNRRFLLWLSQRVQQGGMPTGVCVPPPPP